MKAVFSAILAVMLSAVLSAQEFVHNIAKHPGSGQKKWEYKYASPNGNPHPVKVQKKNSDGTWEDLTEAAEPESADEWKWTKSGNVFTIHFGLAPSTSSELRIVSTRADGVPTPSTSNESWKP
jgi:hypothetical protein